MSAIPAIRVSVDDEMILNIAKEEIRKILADSGEGTWWDLKRLETETCRKRDWLIENILLNPKYREEMKAISNGCERGRWMFRGVEMRNFLDQHFHDLNRKK